MDRVQPQQQLAFVAIIVVRSQQVYLQTWTAAVLLVSPQRKLVGAFQLSMVCKEDLCKEDSCFSRSTESEGSLEGIYRSITLDSVDHVILFVCRNRCGRFCNEYRGRGMQQGLACGTQERHAEREWSGIACWIVGRTVHSPHHEA